MLTLLWPALSCPVLSCSSMVAFMQRAERSLHGIHSELTHMNCEQQRTVHVHQVHSAIIQSSYIGLDNDIEETTGPIRHALDGVVDVIQLEDPVLVLGQVDDPSGHECNHLVGLGV